ncbi:MAG: phosphoribosyl-AMP cyclohydrolase [Spirochaetia bacterium]|nr:phosphoribosyl-AMP cyclohydrolase [Spirochaetia bacterium]
MSQNRDLEEGSALAIDFTKLKQTASIEEDVVPVAVQDAESGEVLIIAYANRKALDYTLKNKTAAFWSTSRNELWVKGATSGDTLEIVDVRVNCEQNSLLYIVKLKGNGACHTKDKNGKTRPGCYYRRIQDSSLEFIRKE